MNTIKMFGDGDENEAPDVEEIDVNDVPEWTPEEILEREG
jgi:hypothetical protein